MPVIRPFKRRFQDRRKREDKYRVNSRIRVPEVRLIDSDGTMIGFMSSREALEKARNKGLDLVEISPHSDPPICKIMDYGKWKFDNKKKERQSKKNQSKILIKEIQLRPRTGEGDVVIKMEKARGFLSQGHKVKINLRFHGREMAHKELGFQILKDIEKRLSDVASIEMPAKMERRTLFTIFAPGVAKPSKKISLIESQPQPVLETGKIRKKPLESSEEAPPSSSRPI